MTDADQRTLLEIAQRLSLRIRPADVAVGEIVLAALGLTVTGDMPRLHQLADKAGKLARENLHDPDMIGDARWN